MQYMQWANGNTELDRLKRFSVAYEFIQAEKVRDSAISGVLQTKAKITELDDSTETLITEIEEMDKNIASLTEEKEARRGGKFNTLLEKVDTLSCSLVKETSMLTNQEESLKTEKASLKKLVKNMEDLKKSISEKDSTVKKAEDGASDIKKRVGDISQNLEE